MRDDDDKPDGNYEVGYGRPPKHTRYKPGQSGNPAGTPPARTNLFRWVCHYLELTDAELKAVKPPIQSRSRHWRIAAFRANRR